MTRSDGSPVAAGGGRAPVSGVRTHAAIAALLLAAVAPGFPSFVAVSVAIGDKPVEPEATAPGRQTSDAPGPSRPRLADPFPARWLDDSGLLTSRFGAVEFEARDGNRLRAETYRATGFDPVEGPIWFVMHGIGRTARSYLEAAAPVAERHGALAIAIRFPEEQYPKNSSYTLGVGRSRKLPGPVHDSEQWRPSHDFLYSELEHVFEATRTVLRGTQTGYYLFGHSAGAQFTQRLLTFLPDARVLGAVAANAGWYTLPTRGDGDDPEYFMPYGLQGTALDDTDLRALLSAPLTILLGERDTGTPDEEKHLRRTAPAMVQGSSRFERGLNYHARGRLQAEALGVPLHWRLRIVPGAGHDKDEVMPSAGFCLFDPESAPCEPSTASEAKGLVITEIHADPARGLPGDANGDGVRDPDDDEFVELVNTGSTPLCLTGWTLTDSTGKERHRFPLGRPVPPGGALVVFGGGQPTGAFGGAEIQWASFGGKLGLSNQGDVLTLLDARGDVVRRVSWGDSDGAPRAEEHLERSLGVDGSVVRWPEPDGPWTVHRDVGSERWSPGTRVDATPW